MDVNGTKTMIVNKNILKICFFIGLPPLQFYETINGNLYAIPEKTKNAFVIVELIDIFAKDVNVYFIDNKGISSPALENYSPIF
jgi:hypothetical protein